MKTRFDFIVIGSGATGFAAAMKANQLGRLLSKHLFKQFNRDAPN